MTAEHHPFVDVLAMRLPEGSYDQDRLSMEMSTAHNVCSKGGGLSNKIVGVEFTLSCGKIMSWPHWQIKINDCLYLRCDLQSYVYNFKVCWTQLPILACVLFTQIICQYPSNWYMKYIYSSCICMETPGMPWQLAFA